MVSSNCKTISTKSARRTTLKLSVSDVDNVLQRTKDTRDEGSAPFPSTKVGVAWDRERESWKARHSVKGVRYFLGRFDRYEDACTTIDEFRAEHGL